MHGNSIVFCYKHRKKHVKELNEIKDCLFKNDFQSFLKIQTQARRYPREKQGEK
jgi:hypothetical protein